MSAADLNDWLGTFAGLLSGLLSIPVFIAANAAFVAAEFALVSVRRTRVKELVAQGITGARRLERATGALDRYLATTQFGITLSSIGLGWLGEPALARLLRPLLASVRVPAAPLFAHSLAFGLAFLAIAFLHIVLGELVPRSVALARPDRVGLWLTPALLLVERVFRPFIWVLSRSGRLVLRILGLRSAKAHAGQVHSVAELTLLVEASEQAGVLERQEREMMHGVLALGDMTVRQIMTARDAIVGVRADAPLEAIVQVVLESGYSRLPVFEGDGDNVTGLLHAKDLLNLYAESQRSLVVLQDLIRQPLFVRDGRRVLDLLPVFQRGAQHLALVLDEMADLVGLVTLEDVLEEVVGEIRDEFDTAEAGLKLERDGTFTAAGATPVRPCLSALGVVPPLWAAGSLDDFLRQVARRPLAEGAPVEFADLVLTVLEADGRGGARRVRIAKGPTSRRAPG